MDLSSVLLLACNAIASVFSFNSRLSGEWKCASFKQLFEW